MREREKRRSLLTRREERRREERSADLFLESMFGMPQSSLVVEFHGFESLKFVSLMNILPVDEGEIFDGTKNDFVDNQLKDFLFRLR